MKWYMCWVMACGFSGRTFLHTVIWIVNFQAAVTAEYNCNYYSSILSFVCLTSFEASATFLSLAGNVWC
jgi:hypothetical protein